MPAQAVLRSGRKVLLTLDPNPDVLGIADWYTEQAQKGALFAPSLSGLVRLEDVEQIRVVRLAWWRRLRAFLRSLWSRFDDWYERSVMDYMASRRVLDDAWLVTEPATGEVLEIEEVDNGA